MLWGPTVSMTVREAAMAEPKSSLGFVLGRGRMDARQCREQAEVICTPVGGCRTRKQLAVPWPSVSLSAASLENGGG